MFIYENKNKDICITFKDNKPVIDPEYIISINADEASLKLNNLPIQPYVSEVLTDNISITSGGKVVENPTIINLNNKVISAENDELGEGVFHIKSGGSLILNGDGIINAVGQNDYNMAIWADGGNVIINGGIYTNKGATAIIDPAHFDLIYAKNGSIVEINDGYFECETPKWTLNLNDSKPGVIIVKGGTFKSYDPSKSYTEPGLQPYNFVAEGYKVIYNSIDDTYSVIKNN